MADDLQRKGRRDQAVAAIMVRATCWYVLCAKPNAEQLNRLHLSPPSKNVFVIFGMGGKRKFGLVLLCSMKEPDFDRDGWCLEDGEARHSGAPETFWIPDSSRRDSLQPGDLAKLLFRVSLDDVADPVAVERMWVLVRGRVGPHYLGVLRNDPSSIGENEELWSGVEIPFCARHVIDIIPADEASRERAKEPPTRDWPRH